MSPSSVHGCQKHDTEYVAFELLLHAAFFDDEVLGDIFAETNYYLDHYSCPSVAANDSLKA